MTRSHARWSIGFAATLVAVMAVASAQAAPSTVTAAQLKSGFKKATGQKLLVDKVRSSTGRYTAFNLGVPTFTKQARYGSFTIFVVAGDVPANVDNLLTNARTGELEPPAAGGIHWEHGAASLGGGLAWTAKQLYGANVVLWWTTRDDVQKTDRTYATLQRALKGIVKQK
jgi:hypothetical protein